MAKSGRKRSLSDTDKAEIIDSIESGLSRRKAAIRCGVSHTTVAREIAADAGFRAKVKKAEVEFEAVHIGRIAKGAPQWQSSAWLLERKFNHWAKKEPKVKAVDANALFVPAQAMASVTPAPGTIPVMARPETVQDREGGPAIGQNGMCEAEAGAEQLGSLPGESGSAEGSLG